MNSIQDLRNCLEVELSGGNKQFLNEGFINYKLIKILIQNGILQNVLSYGYPNRIDISIENSIFIELKYLREAKSEKGKSFAESKKFGELWKDIAKLSHSKLDRCFVLLISDKRYSNYLIGNFPYMLQNEGYVLEGDELEKIKNRVLNTPTMRKELKKFDLNNINVLNIISRQHINSSINDEELDLIFYKVN